MSDRRDAPRFRVALSVVVECGGRRSDAVIENFSVKGMLIKTVGYFEPGSRLRIRVPDTSDAGELIIEASVVRGAPLGRHGVAFVALSAEHLRRLGTLLPAA